MDEFLICSGYSLKAVASVLLVALAGVLLTRVKILKPESTRVISTILFYAALPCLLFSSVARSIDPGSLGRFWILPFACLLFIAVGISMGMFITHLLGLRDDFRRGIIAAAAFSNSGYLPIPLLAAVMTVFPAFGAEAEATAIAYVSAYLVCASPSLWIIGYGLIRGESIRNISWRQILTPPVIGMAAGIAVGITPPLKSLLCESSSWFNPLFRATATLGQATVPLALVLLGANLAWGPGHNSGIKPRAVVAVTLAKLLALPAFAILFIAVSRHFRWLEIDPVMAMVLVVQAAAPPANNLAVMCSLCNPGIEQRMAAVMFWTYLLCIPTLAGFIIISVKLFT